MNTGNTISRICVFLHNNRYIETHTRYYEKQVNNKKYIVEHVVGSQWAFTTVKHTPAIGGTVGAPTPHTCIQIEEIYNGRVADFRHFTSIIRRL